MASWLNCPLLDGKGRVTNVLSFSPIKVIRLTFRDAISEEIKHSCGVKKSFSRIIRMAIIENAINCKILYATSGSICWNDLKIKLFKDKVFNNRFELIQNLQDTLFPYFFLLYVFSGWSCRYDKNKIFNITNVLTLKLKDRETPVQEKTPNSIIIFPLYIFYLKYTNLTLKK